MTKIDSTEKTNLPVSGDDKKTKKKPIKFWRYLNPGTNVIKLNTEQKVKEYTAAIVGFSCKGGDIEEFGKSWNLISVYMNPDPTTGTWWIVADFRTSKSETWNAIDVMFVSTELCDTGNYTSFYI